VSTPERTIEANGVALFMRNAEHAETIAAAAAIELGPEDLDELAV
jgi:hypothetical protein